MSDTSFATGVVLLHPAGNNRLQAWTDRMTDAARTMPGFKALRPAVTNGGLQPAVAATIDTAEHLHAWLDSEALSARMPKASCGSRRTC